MAAHYYTISTYRTLISGRSTGRLTGNDRLEKEQTSFSHKGRIGALNRFIKVVEENRVLSKLNPNYIYRVKIVHRTTATTVGNIIFEAGIETK